MFNITKQGDLNFLKRLGILNQWINGDLLIELGTLSYEHFLEAFPPTSNTARGGKKTDASSGGWLKREKPADSPILNKTGKLKKSIKIIKKSKKSISIETNLDYAVYHNKGTGWLPKREFIGRSRKLNRKTKKYIIMGLDGIFKSSFPKKPYLK